jgi:cell fate regulator YaaT (PSP1 superfamily)
MVYRFLSSLKEIKIADLVYLQGKEEEVLGEVLYVVEAQPGDNVQERLYTGSFDKIGRILSEAERQFVADKAELELRAKQICREKINELQLDMRLSHVHYQPGGGRIIVYFTAENRVDFRELVRLLGTQLKVRVEMRHIGVRDEAKLLGGIGLCGHAFCCTTYLKRFHPVSVRMAKNQDLSLNPEGISGTCGRLLCCLEYENSTYQTLREGMPRLKQVVQTQDGREGTVQAIHPLNETVDLILSDGNRLCVSRCDLCLKAQQPPPGGAEEGNLPPDEAGLPDGAPADGPLQTEHGPRPVAAKGGAQRPNQAKRELQRGERTRGRPERAPPPAKHPGLATETPAPLADAQPASAPSTPAPGESVAASGTADTAETTELHAATRRRRRRRRSHQQVETKEAP